MTHHELVKNLPDSVCWKIAKALDKSNKPNWKTLLSKMPKKTYTDKEINKFHMKILNPGGSPTLALLTDLGKKNRRVEDLILWLKDIESLEHLVNFLCRGDEAIREAAPNVIRQPERNKTCLSGSCCTISFEVAGQDPKYYQWFKGPQIIQGQTCSTLVLNHASIHLTGPYTCRIHNDFGYTFTNWTNVTVINEIVENPVMIPTISSDLDELLDNPIITMHPRSMSLEPGDTIVLQTDAIGNPPPTFQWYFQNEPLLCENKDILIIENAQLGSNDGLYKVKVSNKFGSLFSYASQVTIVEKKLGFLSRINVNNLTIESKPSSSLDSTLEKDAVTNLRGPFRSVSDSGLSSTSSNYPTEKIALLIGNQNYKYEKQLGYLIHPINDVQELTASLVGIGFKVVSLIDLDNDSMKKAINYLYSLIDSRSYVLFYFAGHGFEKNGESFLMSTDATESYLPIENLSLSYILQAVQIKKAKLSVILIDSCRTTPKSCSKDPISASWRNETVQVNIENVIISFGCCAKGRVLESPKMHNSFFAKYLAEYLPKNISILQVILKVSKAIHEKNILDPATGRPQIVHTHSTVNGDLSLTDPIQEQSSQNPRSLLWNEANIAPKSPVIIFSNNYIEVKLSFSVQFTNCLLINTQTIEKMMITNVNLMFILPQYFGGSPVSIISPGEKGEFQHKFIKISNLERLQGDINIHMELIFEIDGVTMKQNVLYCIKEKPLYAKIVHAMSQQEAIGNNVVEMN